MLLGTKARTVEQAADFLQVTQETVLGYIKSGELPASNVGRSFRRPRWRILESDIGLFLANRRRQELEPDERKPRSKKTQAKDYFAESEA
ncbi:MAG: helix-turn-helix domain-containing protein [Aureliella sp.]